MKNRMKYKSQQNKNRDIMNFHSIYHKKKKKTNVFVVYKEIRALRNRRFYRTVKLNLIQNLKIPNISKNTETISIT